MKKYVSRGGARIGWTNATWPFAKLSANHDLLELSCMGTYRFHPSQIVSLEPITFFPLLASGLRIHHNRSDYPEKMIYWCFGNPKSVLSKITQTGLKPAGTPMKRPSGFAIHWQAIGAFIIIWNALLMLDLSPAFSPGQTPKPGWMTFLALLFVFALATGTQKSKKIQSWVIREGHHVGEIKPLLILLQIISALMSVIFLSMGLISRHA